MIRPLKHRAPNWELGAFLNVQLVALTPGPSVRVLAVRDSEVLVGRAFPFLGSLQRLTRSESKQSVCSMVCRLEPDHLDLLRIANPVRKHSGI